jgi:hypothetical protein
MTGSDAAKDPTGSGCKITLRAPLRRCHTRRLGNGRAIIVPAGKRIFGMAKATFVLMIKGAV